MDLTELHTHGIQGPFSDPDLAQWVQDVSPTALAIAQDREHRKTWLRHGDTWFAGVNALPNDDQGNVAASGPLKGAVVDALRGAYGNFSWDRAQISGVYAGYPQKDPEESDAAHRFRRNRDAAHVDGLLPVGPNRRRFLQEPHGFVLGLPLTACHQDASPMVIWEGSHHIIRRAFARAFENVPQDQWDQVDLTDTYTAARKECFAVCRRRTVPAKPGQAYLVHRMALHGVAPWGADADAPKDGRVILYFRPEMPGGFETWMTKP